MKDSQKTKKQLISELSEARQQLEKLAAEVKQSEDKFYKAFSSSPNAVCLVDVDDSKFIEINDSFARFTGYAKEEIIGHTHNELNFWVNPNDMTNMAKSLQETGRLFNAEIKSRMKSGEIRTGLFSAQTLNIGGKNRMILVITDITELKKMEQALRESESKLAVAFRASPHALIIATMGDGKFIEVNDNVCRLTGYSREEIIGHTIDELKIWNDPTFRTRIAKALWEKGRVSNEEVEWRTRAGETLTMLMSAEITEIGGKKCIVSSITDITYLKKMERNLRESEEKFSKAFRASPQAIAITTLKEGRFIEVNEGHTRLTGYSREELIGHTANELTTWANPADRQRIIKILRKKGLIENEELQFHARSGDLQTMLFSAEIINIGDEECIISSSTDVTGRIKMEEALRKSEEKFNKAFRASPGILSISKASDGTFLEINDSFTRIFGFTREETIGHKSLELSLWVNPADRKNMIRQLKELGHVSNAEYRHRTKSGEIRTLLFSAEQIEFDGEPCVLAFTTDITDYKRMEAQAREVANLRELDRLRTELLANVSHELRTPLASIKGFATMLLDYDKRLTPQEKREYLETIDKNTDRLVELIEQLLEMSRLGTGMLSIKKSPVNIINLCQTVISEARVRASTHNFVLDMPPKLPIINIDERRIRQVLDNVIDNAVKYSEAGTEITMTVRKTGKEILFSVTDHGVGIPEKDLPRLFHRMFHSAQRQKTGAAGAGLGLSICKGLIEAHGGKIWIESKEGIGTSCYFTLPIAAAPDDNTLEMRP